MTFMHIVHSKHPEDYKLCTFKQVLIFIVAIFLFFRLSSWSKTKGNIHLFIQSFNQSITHSLNHSFIHSPRLSESILIRRSCATKAEIFELS